MLPRGSATPNFSLVTSLHGAECGAKCRSLAMLLKVSNVAVRYEFILWVNQARGRVVVVVTPATPLAGFIAPDATAAAIIPGESIRGQEGWFWHRMHGRTT
jgi:hypothetical protein